MRRYAAECVGTGVLVFAGVGSAVIAGDKIGFLGVGLAFGIVLVAMAYAIGPISGCHINPAVTAGLLASRKIGPRDAAGYVVAQVVGAIVGAVLLLVVAKARAGGYDAGAQGFGSNGFGKHSPGGYSEGGVFLAEVILTFVLVFTVLAATDSLSQTAFAGIPIGLALGLTNLVGIPIDNASINPARSIGPALFQGDWALEQLWVFVVAPVLGALVAAAIYQALFRGGRQVAPEQSAVASEQSAVAHDRI